jgi:hypothetical protein
MVTSRSPRSGRGQSLPSHVLCAFAADLQTAFIPSFDQAGPDGLQLGSGAGAGKDVGVGREWLLEMSAGPKAGL